jgi:type III pantothenate kinase
MAAPLLLLDVGNTTIEIGFAAGPDLPIVSYRLPTDHALTADALGLSIVQLCRMMALDPGHLAAWVVCSVVPQLDPVLAEAARRYSSVECRFAVRDLPVPLENRYERPQEVGADRLVTAYGARKLFDAPGFIVIDFGTATTFELLAGDDYLGGLICPGVLSSAQALSTRTAKLPQADLRLGTSEIQVGRSTAQSLNQGLVHGFAAMTEGLVERLKPQAPEGSLVVATGGFAKRLQPHCRAFDHVVPDLLLLGLHKLHLESAK